MAGASALPAQAASAHARVRVRLAGAEMEACARHRLAARAPGARSPGTSAAHPGRLGAHRSLKTSSAARRWGPGGAHGAGQHRGPGPARAQQQQQEQAETYQGVYGPWQVEDADKAEVLVYRAGLNVASLCLLGASLPALLPGLGLGAPQDSLFWGGAAGLGVSLVLIHIYVTPIKRTLQAFWALGLLGAALLQAYALPGSEQGSLLLYVVEHPLAIWAVGPLFAALTGLVFKEGLCYGKLEAALLVFLIPSLLLGHLSGILSPDVERGLLGTWVALSLVFSLRKFTQPIKDDIGDKSVFTFRALPPQEQERILLELQSGALKGADQE